MIYSEGDQCWNGPKRSTKVNLICGLRNELVSVSEPNKCEYLFNFETPAACQPLESLMEDDNYIFEHDEL